jgi:hypothetical protein
MDERLKVQNGDQDEEILQSDHRKHLSGVSTKFLPLQVDPTRGFSVLFPYRDYVSLSVAIGIYSSV